MNCRGALLIAIVSLCATVGAQGDRISKLLPPTDENRLKLVAMLGEGPMADRAAVWGQARKVFNAHAPAFTLEEVRKVVASLDTLLKSREIKQKDKVQAVRETAMVAMYNFRPLGDWRLRCGTMGGEVSTLLSELKLVLQTNPRLMADAMKLDCETACSLFPSLYIVDPKLAKPAMLHWLKAGTPQEKEAAVVALLPTLSAPSEGELVRPFLETDDRQKVVHIQLLVGADRQKLLYPDGNVPKALKVRLDGGR
jgi:hypothetical protein